MELRLYSGANLSAIVRQLETQLSRDDPGEEFKVSQSVFDMSHDEMIGRVLKYCVFTAAYSWSLENCC